MSFKQAVKNVMSKGGKKGRKPPTKEEASAMVASASRDASSEAKKANPKLSKVKGKSGKKC